MPKTIIKHTDFESNESIFLLNTSLDDYRLSWLISKELGVEFHRSSDIVFFQKDINEELLYTVYKACLNDSTIYIFANKNENSIKLVNIRNADFFLKIKSANLFEITTKIKKINGVNILTIVNLSAKNDKKAFNDIIHYF